MWGSGVQVTHAAPFLFSLAKLKFHGIVTFMGPAHQHNHDHSHSGAHGSEHGGAHDHNHYHFNAFDPRNESRIGLAAILTGTFMIIEVIGGYISGSLALIADAGHMLTDSAALALAWLGFRLARRPADWKRTFGFDRFAVLAAFVNGVSLFAIAGFIILEAIHRVNGPNEVMGLPMLLVATTGLLVNIAVFFIISSADKDNLNVRAAALHVLGDLLGSAAAIIAALIIYFTGWMPIDLIVSVLVAVIILRSAWYIVKSSAHILLEGAPEGLDRRTISADMQAEFPQIIDIDHIHAWSISQERPMMTLEAIITQDGDIEAMAQAIKNRLHDKFGVEHATVEVKTQKT